MLRNIIQVTSWNLSSYLSKWVSKISLCRKISLQIGQLISNSPFLWCHHTQDDLCDKEGSKKEYIISQEKSCFYNTMAFCCGKVCSDLVFDVSDVSCKWTIGVKTHSPLCPKQFSPSFKGSTSILSLCIFVVADNSWPNSKLCTLVTTLWSKSERHLLSSSFRNVQNTVRWLRLRIGLYMRREIMSINGA